MEICFRKTKAGSMPPGRQGGRKTILPGPMEAAKMWQKQGQTTLSDWKIHRELA
jgi:hypothetical protein